MKGWEFIEGVVFWEFILLERFLLDLGERVGYIFFFWIVEYYRSMNYIIYLLIFGGIFISYYFYIGFSIIYIRI